ncbi:MAG: glycosyltransferase [Gemmatimonadaceae bacterium]|nr:glycosyltransferase [Gemmatimonadaceae bacterium]
MAPPRDASRIRIVYCLDSFDTGGTELNAVRTVEQIDRSRFDVSFVALSDRGALAARVREAGIPIEVFPLNGFFSLQALRSGRALVRYLRRERVDVLHAHDIYSNIFAVICARIAGVPMVIASRRWWYASNRKVYLILNRWTYRLAHRVLANAEAVGALVAREGIDPSHIVVVPNFVEDYAFAAPDAAVLTEWRRDLRIAPDDETIGIVANLFAVKDHDTLLRAFQRVVTERPHARLVLVGDGPERAALARLASGLGVADRVSFAGRRPQSPTMHWLFDVSVLCSRHEGFPNSVVEAMAAGRPVVATRVGGIPDVVVDGDTGYLVPSGDVEALADRLRFALANAAERARLGSAGAARARNVFHSKRVMATLERLYADFLSQGGRRLN